MLGLPHAIEVTAAEMTDRAGALKAITRCLSNLTQVTSVLADGGYSGQPFAAASVRSSAPRFKSPSATNCIPSK